MNAKELHDRRPVVGYEGQYEIDTDGRVWSLLHRSGRPWLEGPRQLSSRIRRRYPSVTLWKDGVNRTSAIHILALEAFVGPRPPEMEGCHNDGNPLNSRLENLRWDTRAGNCADRKRHGTALVGAKNHKTKLTPQSARTIHERVRSGESQEAVGRAMGVSQRTVHCIVTGKRWAAALAVKGVG